MSKLGDWLMPSFLALSRTSRNSRRRNARRRQSVFRQMPVEHLEQRLLLTLNLVIDYTYDTSGFFNEQARRDVLEEVATVYEARIGDTLNAITPGGVNSWTAVFAHPTTGVQTTVQNLSIPADTVTVYVGARDLSSGLGLGGPGGFSSLGTPDFNVNLETRGEAGVNPSGSNDTDFAPWGGTISFDSEVTWNFSMDPPSAGQNDFYSVALHEMAHVLGFGTSDAFRNLINASNLFTGTASVAAHGSSVPMHADSLGNPDSGHWASGISSTLPGTTIAQETSMDPQVTTGSRKHLTVLDWAALDDLGWEVSDVAGPVDYGDAPDATAGTGPANYNTREANNGPSHTVVSGLFIGTSAADADDGNLQNADATADETGGENDEGFAGSDSLTIEDGVATMFQVRVTNETSSAATLYAWIDANADGVFDTDERAQANVPAGTTNGAVTLSFPAFSSVSDTATTTFARFRLSTDTAASQPTGAATNGEVEDHAVTITRTTNISDTLPSFSWPPASDAVRYELEVVNVSAGNTVVIQQSQLKRTNYRPENALIPSTYSWRYRPFTAAGAGPWSDPQEFTIEATTGKPSITDPVPLDDQTGAAALPTFAWTAVTGATRYQLWVDDLTNSVEQVINHLNLNQTSFTPSRALTAGDYRAWVRPFDSNGPLAAWSDPYDFTVSSSGTTAGEITGPVGTSINAAPTIAWRHTNGIQRLIVTDTDTDSVVIDINDVNGSSYTPGQGLAPGNYEARLEVDGNIIGAGSEFQIVETSAGGASFTNLRDYETNPVPTFGWTAVPTANRYELWVDDVTNGVSRLIYDNTLTSTAYQSTTALTPGVYRAWIRANNDGTPVGSWSSPITFRVTEATTTPTIHAPLNDTLNTLPTFAWSAVQNATSYAVVISQNGTPVVSVTSVENFVTLENALPLGDYSVTVTATGIAGQNSDTATFSIGTTSGSVRILNMSGTTVNTRPTFSWPTVENATRYTVWVNDDTRNLVATVFDSEVGSTTFTPDSALLPGRHRVWVRAFNSSGPLTEWSPAAPFVIAETAAPPTVTAPVTTSTNVVPAITWTAVAQAASYQLEVADSAATGTPIVYAAEDLTATFHRPATALDPGEYTVRVRSVDSSGSPSAWSSDYAFSIQAIGAADVPEIVTPLLRSTISGTEVLFAWTSSSVAGARYDVWVSNLTNSTRPVFETELTTHSLTATNLPAGRYRAWVRVIGEGANSAWSVGQDFTVV